MTATQPRDTAAEFDYINETFGEQLQPAAATGEQDPPDFTADDLSVYSLENESILSDEEPAVLVKKKQLSQLKMLQPMCTAFGKSVRELARKQSQVNRSQNRARVHALLVELVKLRREV